MHERLAAEPYCYLTTTGRVSGLPRQIEIWFGLRKRTIFMLSGGGTRSNWVRNLLADPRVAVEIGGEGFRGRARIVADPAEEAAARELVAGKYDRLDSDWRRSAVVVAVDLEP